jgi:uncharacterized protein YndB with AHSA1/START domain
MTDARLISGRRASLRLIRHLADPPEIVWSAITDRDELRSWFPCDVEVLGGKWKVGAVIVFRFPPAVIDMTLDGRVLVVDPPKLLSYTWGEESLRFELSAEGSGTRLVLTDELPSGSAARNAAGWDECLDRLSGRPSLERLNWTEAFAKYAQKFSSMLGPQEGPPLGHTVAR